MLTFDIFRHFNFCLSDGPKIVFFVCGSDLHLIGFRLSIFSDVCVSSVKWLLLSFASFPTSCVFLVDFGVFYIFWIWILGQFYVLKIFFQFVAYLFIFFYGIFWPEVLNFNLIRSINFLMNCAFVYVCAIVY